MEVSVEAGPSALSGATLQYAGPGAGSNAGVNAQQLQNTQPPKKRKRIKPQAPLDPLDVPRYTPWLPTKEESVSVSVSESAERRLHDEICTFTEWAMTTTQESAAREHAIDLVSQAGKAQVMGSQVHVFGSVAQGLCLPSGDIDMVMQTRAPVGNTKRLLYQLSAALKRMDVTDDVQVVAHARVPIMSFRTRPEHGGFKIDLGINNDDGLRGVSVINGYLDRMPALRPLVLVLKAFLSQRGLASAATSGLSSYSLICMLISFIQMNPQARPRSAFEDPLAEKSLGTLLIDFLQYYAFDFPYETSYVCARESRLGARADAPWIGEEWPEWRLVIECLINPERDIGRSLGRIRDVRTAFQEAHAALMNFNFSENANENSQITSILGQLIRVSERSMDERERLRTLVDTKTLGVKAAAPKTGHESHRNGKSYRREVDTNAVGNRALKRTHESRRGGSRRGHDSIEHARDDGRTHHSPHGKYQHQYSPEPRLASRISRDTGYSSKGRDEERRSNRREREYDSYRPERDDSYRPSSKRYRRR